MPNDPVVNLFDRVSKLETRNRLKGGFDYPQIPYTWTPNVSLLDGSTGGWCTTSTSFTTIFNSLAPMQNPKMAFRFQFRNSVASTLSSWSLVETTSGLTIATGNQSTNSFQVVELHIDTSPFFSYGVLANYQLNGKTASSGTFAARADYIGGSWTPEAAVAF